ncbi:NDR1/HIN1-like protein 10 [Pyrus x bretschneideri]|uniref:NDR1/HIN1-like protein 10 n=1 Tax=Pyrus x bretschneideri TaxID=225117 RepID=UPI00202EE89A|nr:NDR1/HIN1-like protein 10 [Pyrus x bretschneideri]
MGVAMSATYTPISTAKSSDDCENPDSVPISATKSTPLSACDQIFWVLMLALLLIAFALLIGLRVSPEISSSGYKCPDFTVNGAHLTQFDYTESNRTLSYNLALNITLTNPKKKLFLGLIDVKVSAYYQDKRIGQVTLMDRSMSLTPKNTTIFQNVIVQGHDMLFEQYQSVTRPAAAELYSIDVVIAFQDMYTVQRGEVIYNLRLPLSSNGTYWDADKITNCSM